MGMDFRGSINIKKHIVQKWCCIDIWCMILEPQTYIFSWNLAWSNLTSRIYYFSYSFPLTLYRNRRVDFDQKPLEIHFSTALIFYNLSTLLIPQLFQNSMSCLHRKLISIPPCSSFQITLKFQSHVGSFPQGLYWTFMSFQILSTFLILSSHNK